MSWLIEHTAGDPAARFAQRADLFDSSDIPGARASPRYVRSRVPAEHMAGSLQSLQEVETSPTSAADLHRAITKHRVEIGEPGWQAHNKYAGPGSSAPEGCQPVRSRSYVALDHMRGTEPVYKTHSWRALGNEDITGSQVHNAEPRIWL